MGMLNALPAASSIKTNYPPAAHDEINLWNYPTRPDKFHARAYNDRILDLKSYAISELFGYMGLGSPEDTAYQLEFGSVVLRNWDPISYGPSKYVNGSLLSWVVNGGTNALPFPVDITSRLRHWQVQVIIDLRLNAGRFIENATRDDRGLRYLYRKDNFNIENLPPNTFQIITNQPNITNPAVFSIDLRWFS